jgi:hypothetical protein
MGLRGIRPDEMIELHPLAKIFPRVGDHEFDELVASIQERGVKHPVTLFEGKLLDGRHRLDACRVLDIECPAIIYTGPDPVGLVEDENLRHRHLSKTERAVAVAELANYRLGITSPQTSATAPGAVSDSAPEITRAQREQRAEIQAELGEKHDVSLRMIQKAQQILDHNPELLEKVKAGEMGLKEAGERIAEDEALRQARKLVKKSMPAKPKQSREGLLAETVVTLKKRIEALEIELTMVSEGAADAVIQAQAAQAVLAGEAPKRIIELEHELRSVKASRDLLLDESGQLKRQIKQLERQLGRK